MHEAGDDQVRQERGQLEAGQELLKRLSHVAVAIQLPSSREDRLREFLRGACDVVGFDRAWVLLASADGGAFELVSPAGDADGVPTARLPLDSRAGPFYHAWKSRRPVAVLTHEDVQALPPLAPEYLAHPFFRTRSFVIAPLLAGDRVIGVACADNKPSRRPILPLQVEPFALLCQQVATALDNARLYDEAERRRRQAEVLADLARDIGASLELGAVLQRVVEGARELCGAEAARIALRNAEGDAFTFRHGAGTLYPTNWTIVPGKGLGGRVLETGRPLRTDDYANDPRFSKDFLSMARADRIAAMMAVPILIKDRVEGLIFVDRHEPRPFTEGDEAILGQLAEHAAIAIGNAGIYEMAEARRREAEAGAEALRASEQERARLFAEAENRRTRLEQIFASTSDGILVLDLDGRVTALNRRGAELLGILSEEVVEHPLRRLVGLLEGTGVWADPANAALLRAIEAGEGTGSGDLELRVPRPATLHWQVAPTRDVGGGTVGLTVTFQDVTHEREVSRMKSDFVSFVTHQLRTPLAGIKWMLELAAQGPEVDAETRSYVVDARGASQRLIDLVNDLLDVSRLESGRLSMVLRPTSLPEVTRSVLEELGPLLRERGHRVSVEGGEGLPSVVVDPQLLRQVVLNLVSNAVKYTPPAGTITIRLGGDAGSVRWEIRDTGIGIPREGRRRLFEKFYRAENALAIETEGTGLGLYLARLIVERFGGRITCESQEGEGSTFTVTLPRRNSGS